MKCKAHAGPGRPRKDCPDCQALANKPATEMAAVSRQYGDARRSGSLADQAQALVDRARAYQRPVNQRTVREVAARMERGDFGVPPRPEKHVILESQERRPEPVRAPAPPPPPAQPQHPRKRSKTTVKYLGGGTEPYSSCQCVSDEKGRVSRIHSGCSWHRSAPVQARLGLV